ncbi:MAG TPA: acyl-CoA synthetase [Acidimicrobiales bacterium]|nr:acyl-CoA synthetase [Acidimicrobiales bacterium]
MSWNLADLFEAVADNVPTREAVVCAEADGTTTRSTYAQLDRRANRLAHVLAGRGIGPGDRVGLQLANGNEYLEAMLACFKLRALPVNVNYRYVAEELRHLFEVSGTALVIHEPDLTPAIDEVRDELPLLRSTLVRGDDYEAALAVAPTSRPVAERSGDDRYVLYTGGTTGRPKGVVWRHEDIFHAALSGASPLRPGLSTIEEVRAHAPAGRARCLVASPLIHGTGHWMALSTLFRGGTVIVMRARGLDAGRLWEVAASEAASWLVIVGDAFARPLVDALEGDTACTARAGTVTVIMSGGSTLSPSVKSDLLRLLPTVVLVDGFGASETGGQGRMVSAPGADVDGAGSFVPGEGTTVLDDDLRPLSPGDGRTGWLARRGHIPVGYLGDPESSTLTFPEVDGVRWAVPGDRATIAANGNVVVFGRGSTSINSGGEKVHPEEVESALRSHPEVFDAVVVGAPDPRWGEVITAIVQPRPGRAPCLPDLADHCRRTMAAFKVPRRLLLVDEVRRSPSGKPDYRWARSVIEG